MSTSFARTCAQVALASGLVTASIAAQAQTVTLSPGVIESVNGLTYGLQPGSTQTLTLGESFLAFLDVTKAQVSSPGLPFTIALDNDGAYAQVSTTGATSSAQLSLNNGTGKTSVQSVTDSNSISFTVPVNKSISDGGQLTISNLSADYGTRQVFGDVSGTGLANPLIHVHLLNAASLTSDISANIKPGDFVNTNYSVTLSGLSLTNTGLNTFVQMLKLQALPKGMLIAGAGDLGSLTANLVLNGAPINYTAPIPEPSTWAMMALGLIGLAGVTRRHPRA